LGLGTLSSWIGQLGGSISTARGGTSVLLDAGANVDSKPAHLVQFAVMGEIYYRAIFGTRRPKVACSRWRRRNEGQRTDARGAQPPETIHALNFVGNVEGGKSLAGMWM